ncbi:hyccin isoform X1 [Pieris brassicae]|uniref:hyccin isoform X1 n=2 Tax=Pieris brassicae TaxID=7116 RepID=UPI001E66147C|nr:hyccin isoform X1 [Pieris brassicae]XP_045518934.1 hyccin isoform X1 [Pieris brassicae]XP_045518935.1 hyccin isoform X1 [Pieris brassicae]XP_045518936.1 hyccin isoform X1 [Pieris brassicae]XP_045518937.1 hyccin isoform X1 [Pieris brassicae]
MADGKHLIKEWLSEYSSLQEHEIKSFAAEHEHNHEIATAIFNLIYNENHTESPTLSQDVCEEMLENVCMQLFSFYRSKEIELQRFTLQFVPIFIYIYLSSVAVGNTKSIRSIETLLIGLYNFEVVDENGKPKVVSFRLPSLAQASIYHEPLSLGSQFLTESALRRWEECNTKLVSWGPLSQVEILNAQNRLKVMAALLFIYNRHLSLLPKLALRYFCISASRIVTQGFNLKTGPAKTKSIQRIPVSSNFLLEMIEGAYFAMFNEFYTLALQAVQDIDERAQYELLPDVMLVTSAVINSLNSNPSGQPCDGPMGISVALSPATTTVTMSKSMITNASFRTKKLPDDIPIQAGQVVPTDSTDILTSITEEAEVENAAPMQRGAQVRNSKPKLSAFPVLGKKTKDPKEKNTNTTDKKSNIKEASKGIWNSISGGGDMVDAQQKSGSSDIDGNSSQKDEISMTSVQNSTETSDSRSQITTDSLDIETGSRFSAMQVSSV